MNILDRGYRYGRTSCERRRTSIYFYTRRKRERERVVGLNLKDLDLLEYTIGCPRGARRARVVREEARELKKIRKVAREATRARVEARDCW